MTSPVINSDLYPKVGDSSVCTHLITVIRSVDTNSHTCVWQNIHDTRAINNTRGQTNVRFLVILLEQCYFLYVSLKVISSPFCAWPARFGLWGALEDFMKWHVQCKQFSEQDGVKLGEWSSQRDISWTFFYFFWKGFVSSTSDEKEANKTYNPEIGITILVWKQMHCRSRLS